MKYIVVTGGVVSGLGKGISISSIGVLLKACGLRVTSIKIDPYLNSDAGTMSPFEHGEVGGARAGAAAAGVVVMGGRLPTGAAVTRHMGELDAVPQLAVVGREPLIACVPTRRTCPLSVCPPATNPSPSVAPLRPDCRPQVFVLNDGGEADLDLGNYERFLDVTLTRDHNITTGKVYSRVSGVESRGWGRHPCVGGWL